MIRARMVELRRERAQAVAEAEGRSVTGPTPYPRAVSARRAVRTGGSFRT